MHPVSSELAAVVARARLGEREAFDRLIRLTAQEVTSFVAARVRSVALIDELVQDSYVEALQDLSTLHDPLAFVSWVKGIARHRLLRQMDERARRRERSLDEVLEDLQTRRSNEMDDESGEYEIRARLEKLRHCLERLDSRARLLAAQHWVEGIPVNRLAQRYKRSADAISSSLTRIRSQLRSCVSAAETAP